MEGKSIENQTLTLDHETLTNSSPISPIIQEWESKARIWLSSLPDPTNVTTSQLESWISSNQVSLPEELQSLPRHQLLDQILSLNQITPQSDQGKDSGGHPARFQRTDQWIPVYAWLESLDRNEVVKSKDITDWLSENPNVKEKLYSRHSRYHLMHYVQKCHMKILKRQGKLQKAIGTTTGNRSEPQAVKPLTAKISMPFVGKAVPTVPVPHSGTPSGNSVKNKDVSLAKRTDDFLRYQLFTELESQLSSMLSKQDKQTA